jgi:NADH:ubiquinone oxidoreductase subunit F (NADH-binding)
MEKKLKAVIGDYKIELFKKDFSASYIGGEETSVLNHIEGRRVEPRFRPPFPVVAGLYGYPTLINNVETFYDIFMIERGEYRKTRFYTIDGDCLYTGVYEFPDDLAIDQILKKTDNYPKFDFFVQIGGNGAGFVYNSSQLDQAAGGSGSITVYSMIKHRPLDLIRGWIDFFQEESCGQCTACREGNYRLKEMLDEKEPDWQLFYDILINLGESSFCGLGTASGWAVGTYIKNVILEYGLEAELPAAKNLKDIFKQLNYA